MSSSQVQRRHKLNSLGLNRLLAIAREAGARVTGTMAGSDIVDAIIAVEEQCVVALEKKTKTKKKNRRKPRTPGGSAAVTLIIAAVAVPQPISWVGCARNNHATVSIAEKRTRAHTRCSN